VYNPDGAEEKKLRIIPKSPDVSQNDTQGRIEVLSEKEKLRFYIMEGGMASCYGLKVVDNKLIIVDLPKLERLDGKLKDVIREIFLEHRK
jgi:hypothetical protein